MSNKSFNIAVYAVVAFGLLAGSFALPPVGPLCTAAVTFLILMNLFLEDDGRSSLSNVAAFGSSVSAAFTYYLLPANSDAQSAFCAALILLVVWDFLRLQKK